MTVCVCMVSGGEEGGVNVHFVDLCSRATGESTQF